MPRQKDLDCPILLLCQDDLAAARLTADINAMAGNGKELACLFPSRDFCYRQMETISGEYEQQRLGVLSRIQAGEVRIVVASAQAAASRTISPEQLQKGTFQLSVEPGKGEQMTMEQLVVRLSESGYIRRDQVDGVCQYLSAAVFLTSSRPRNPTGSYRIWGTMSTPFRILSWILSGVPIPSIPCRFLRHVRCCLKTVSCKKNSVD